VRTNAIKPLLPMAILTVGFCSCNRRDIQKNQRLNNNPTCEQRLPLGVHLIQLDTKAAMSLPKEKIAIFTRANTDLDLVSSGRDPLYSRLSGVFLDGGTKQYTSSEYVITSWHELRQIHGVSCNKRGVSIKFNDPVPALNGLLDDFSYTWVEF
jgi:hypothetical protein